jgi:hypothetical protein
VAGAFDGFGHLALMAGTRPGLAAGADLSAVRDQTAEHVHVLIIDRLVFLGTKLANADAAWSATSTIFALVVPAFFVSAARAAVVIKGSFHDLSSHPGAGMRRITIDSARSRP